MLMDDGHVLVAAHSARGVASVCRVGRMVLGAVKDSMVGGMRLVEMISSLVSRGAAKNVVVAADAVKVLVLQRCCNVGN